MHAHGPWPCPCGRVHATVDLLPAVQKVVCWCCAQAESLSKAFSAFKPGEGLGLLCLASSPQQEDAAFPEAELSEESALPEALRTTIGIETVGY